MDVQAPVVFLRCFSSLTDPRGHNVRHLFADILAIAVLAVMCRSDDWEEVVLYGRANQDWLATFLELPNGIPCEDTFSRLFARINPDAFEKCFKRSCFRRGRTQFASVLPGTPSFSPAAVVV